MTYAIGIDIGGTTIASGIVNQYGDIIQREIINSDPTDREKMFERVVTCVERLLTHSSIPVDQIDGIGIGVPGKVDRQNGIAVFQNNLPWTNFPIAEKIREKFHVDNVVIDNDVYMAAFAEWSKLGLTDDELFVYLTISTGISCSVIRGGEFIRGAGFAGELGLVPVVAPNEDEPIERLEKIAAGPAIEKYAKEKFQDAQITAADVFKKLSDSDLVAEQLIDDTVSSLTHGLYMVTSLLDPHKIVLGGSVATHNPVLLSRMKEKLATHVIDEQKHILDNIETSTLGNEQGIIGAGLSVLK